MFRKIFSSICVLSFLSISSVAFATDAWTNYQEIRLHQSRSALYIWTTGTWKINQSVCNPQKTIIVPKDDKDFEEIFSAVMLAGQSGLPVSFLGTCDSPSGYLRATAIRVKYQ